MLYLECIVNTIFSSIRLTYEGDMVEVVVVVEDEESFKPVLGCFWMVSSWPSNVLRY